MSILWVLTANGSCAKIYRVKGMGKSIEKVHDIENPEAKKKGTDILTDRPGRTFDSVGVGRHAVGREETPHIHEQQVFAQSISGILKLGFEENAYDELALIASPQFLGILRKELSESITKKIQNQIDKDIASAASESECVELMCRYLDLWNR